MKKNKALSITITHEAYEKLEILAKDQPVPTIMRWILEASAEHKGTIYSLLAILARTPREYN